jgi:hypothetical protein
MRCHKHLSMRLLFYSFRNIYISKNIVLEIYTVVCEIRKSEALNARTTIDLLLEVPKHGHFFRIREFHI